MLSTSRAAVVLLAKFVFIGGAARLHSTLPGEWPAGEILDASSVNPKAHTSDVYSQLTAFAWLLLAATPSNAFRHPVYSQKVRHQSSPSMGLQLGHTSADRRAILAAVPPLLAVPGIAAAAGGVIRFSGVYDDPKHPDCRRIVKPQGSGIVITGTDEIGGKEWKVYGKVQGDEVVIDFSPKGGPKDIVAKFDGDVESFMTETPASFKFSDGNTWTRLSQKSLVTASGYAGAYYVLDGKQSLRRKVFMSGYRARVIGTDVMGGPEWEVQGRFQDGKLVIDFSPLGGGSAVSCVKTTKGLEFSDGKLWNIVGSAR